MPGPTTMVVMLDPALLGGLLAVLILRQRTSELSVVGAWLVLLVFPLAVGSNVLRERVSDPAAFNRVEWLLLAALALLFLALNRRSHRIVMAATGSIALGTVLNAVAILRFGYMPVSAWGTAVSGDPIVGVHPAAGYLNARGLGPVALALGDSIPVPGGLQVLSIGDLLIMGGCAVLLGVFFAWLVHPPAEAPQGNRTYVTGGR